MASIAFLGAGNIAQAIMGGLSGDNHELYAYDPVPACRDAAAAIGATITENNKDAIEQADVVILCVKPNVVPDLLVEEAASLREKMTISVAAGITTQTMLSAIGDSAAVVRCMPNTPALVKAGMTALFATPGVSGSQRDLAQTILSAVGKTLWVTDENALDAVTAISGSGPAYFFLMMESMIAAAEAEGLDADTSRQLVIQTALGAANMAHSSDDEPAQLRINVTSPGGTTQAALETFESLGLPDIVRKAVNAARVRSEELSQS
ncbi:MAG: pyrroline-5-carboxylate reductase [Pseudomonadales bacterium]|nr:pyrroline-5-carboxylate reductase [Pseudomonadales bacterium]